MIINLLSITILSIDLSEALINCNKTVSKLQLCSVKPHNPEFPDMTSKEGPMDLKMTLNLVSVAEFDDEDNTLLLNVIHGFVWRDTRITLEYPDNQ